MKAASLRDRQRQEAIQEIVDAAFDLFELHGYNNTTIRRIADRVGIAPRTFFRYFPRKEDVVFGDQESIIARLRAGLAEIGGEGSPVPAVTRGILTVQDPASNARRERTRAQLIQQVPAVRARGLRLVEALEVEVATTLLRHLPERHRQMAIARMIAGAIFGSLRGAR
jgi:AcrR family transcriptional regulator